MWWLAMALAPEASADEPAPVPAPLEPVPTFASELHDAEQAYFQGRSGEARDRLGGLVARVLAGEEVAPELVADAFTWLGEIQYTEGDPEAARLTFRTLLRAAPDTPVSQYHHPLEVVNLFELVRAEVVAENVAPPEVARVPVPAWVVVPFGFPQLAQRRPAAGLALGGLELATGGASLVAYAMCERINPSRREAVQNEEPRAIADKPKLRTLRYAVQWPTSAAFYTLWTAGTVDAVGWHRKQQAPIAVLPQLERPGVWVAGRF